MSDKQKVPQKIVGGKFLLISEKKGPNGSTLRRLRDLSLQKEDYKKFIKAEAKRKARESLVVQHEAFIKAPSED